MTHGVSMPAYERSGPGRSRGSAAIAAAVLRYYQVRFESPATRMQWRRIGLVALGIVLAVVVAVTATGVVTGNPWWGLFAVLAAAVAAMSAAFLLALVALRRIRVIGPGSARGRSFAPRPPRPPLNRRQARPGVISAGERAKIETLERLYLHRKAVVDRSAKTDHGPEAQAWSDMIEAKVKLGLCGWPGCRNRDWAYSFCAEHDSRRTGVRKRVRGH
jgi:hypothetical protein